MLTDEAHLEATGLLEAMGLPIDEKAMLAVVLMRSAWRNLPAAVGSSVFVAVVAKSELAAVLDRWQLGTPRFLQQ